MSLTPTAGVEPTQPSFVYRKSLLGPGYVPEKWAWFNGVLYLTQCVFGELDSLMAAIFSMSRSDCFSLPQVQRSESSSLRK